MQARSPRTVRARCRSVPARPRRARPPPARRPPLPDETDAVEETDVPRETDVDEDTDAPSETDGVEDTDAPRETDAPVESDVAPAPAPLRLDAGTPHSPVLQDFAGLRPDRADDPRATWSTPPRRAEWTPARDPLVGDGVHGGTLHLDLTPGPWVFFAQLGEPVPTAQGRAGVDQVLVLVNGERALQLDRPTEVPALLASPLHAANPRPVFDPDETPWERQELPDTPWHRFEVDVPEDGLELAVDGLPLQALVAHPLADAARAEVDTVLADGRRRLAWSRHVEAPVPPQLAPPRVAEGAFSVGVGYLGGGPVAGARHQTHPVRMARRDHVARLLWLHGAQAAGSWRVSHRVGKTWVSGVPEGLTLQLSEAVWLDDTGHPDQPLAPRPTHLVPGDGWLGGQGLVPVAALTLTTQASTPAGTHEILLHFLDETGDSRAVRDATITLQVQIEPPVLDPDDLHAGLFLDAHPTLAVRGGADSAPVIAWIDGVQDHLAARHLDTHSLERARWPGAAPRSPEEAADEPLLAHARARWTALGGHALIWADPLARGVRRRVYQGDGPVEVAIPFEDRPALAATLALTDGPGVPVWIHAWDEEGWFHHDAPERARPLLDRLHDLGPADLILSAAVSVPGTFREVSQDFGVAYLTSLGGVPDLAALGDVPHRWTYNLAPGASGPLQAWAAGAEGHLQWHASWPAGDPFDSLTPPRPWRLLRLTADGEVASSVGLEAFAAGVATARLLAEVEDRLTGRRGRRHEELRAWLDAVRAHLDTDPAQLVDAQVVDGLTHARLRTRALDALKRLPPPR